MLSYIATTLACKPVLEITPQVAIPRAQSVSPASGTPNITRVELLFRLHSASLPPFLILYICVSFMYFFFLSFLFFSDSKRRCKQFETQMQQYPAHAWLSILFATVCHKFIFLSSFLFSQATRQRATVKGFSARLAVLADVAQVIGCVARRRVPSCASWVLHPHQWMSRRHPLRCTRGANLGLLVAIAAPQPH